MPGIDDVLERLLTDSDFARRLATDPAAALAGYELSADDLSLLSSQVSFDPGALSLVEERVSKAGMFGLLTSFSAGLGSIVGPDHSLVGLGGPDTAPTGLGGPDTAPTGLGGPDTAPTGLGGPDTSPEAHLAGGVDNPEILTGSEGIFRSVGGLSVETDVSDYQEGGVTDAGGVVIGNPNIHLGGTQGIIIDTSVDNPEIMPDPPPPAAGGDGASPNIVVQGATFPSDDAANPNNIVQGG